MATQTNDQQQQKPEPETSKGPLVAKVGNLTGDPELNFGAESGKAFTRMRLAVSTPINPGDWVGERETTFYDMTAFGTLAEHCAQSLRRGMRVVVNGRGEIRTWTGDDGVERTGKAILVDAIGPDLRWATVDVRKAGRTSQETAGSSDFDEDF